MGVRGPAKGRGGRPSGGKKTATKRASNKREAKQVADDLAGLTFDELRTHCAQWQPLETQDELLLVVLWEVLRRYRKLAQKIHETPVDQWFTETEKGYAHQMPQLGLINKAVEQILSLSCRFGLSPADRIRMGEPPTQSTPESMLGNLMSRSDSLHGHQQAETNPARKKRR